MLVHAEMEAKCGPLVEAYAKLVRALANAWAPAAQAQAQAQAQAGGEPDPRPRADVGAVAPVVAALQSITATTDAVLVAMLKMFNASDPRNYVRFVRPWIFGWKGNPDFARGVVFEGCGEGGTDLATWLRGETGAQSTIVPSLDAALGIVHSQDALREMLADLDAYRPPPHRAFLAQLRTLMWGGAHAGGIGPSSQLAPHLLRDYVRAAGSRALVRAYNAAVANVYAFRAIHVVFAEAYISRFTALEAATGGTPYRAYLRKHRGESESAQILDGPGGAADAAVMLQPTPEQSRADLEAIFSDDTANGIPRFLIERHVEIIARHGLGPDGRIEESLVRKCFPTREWARSKAATAAC